MENILIGIVLGWLLSFIYGWNRRSHWEHKEFYRGYKLGKKYNGKA